MKRDMDMIRSILFALEEKQDLGALEKPDDNWDDASFYYQQYLLLDAGLVYGKESMTFDSKHPEAVAISLTWDGHEFLDSIRDDGIWKSVKERVAVVGGATLPVLIEVATSAIKQKLNLE